MLDESRRDCVLGTHESAVTAERTGCLESRRDVIPHLALEIQEFGRCYL